VTANNEASERHLQTDGTSASLVLVTPARYIYFELLMWREIPAYISALKYVLDYVSYSTA